MSRKHLLYDELHTRVDEVLHYLWDPIGVRGIPMARDEYQSYVPNVVALLNENASLDRVAGYLNEVVTIRMGLRENMDEALSIAAILRDWKETADEKCSVTD